MKTTHLVHTSLVILVASSTCLAGLSDGLVAYYPFNGNADDASGNGHNGGVFGALLTSGYDGLPNSAYQFDGTNDYVAVPYSAAFQLPAYTLAAWCRPTRDFSQLESTTGDLVARGEDVSTDHVWGTLGVTAPNPVVGHGAYVFWEDNGDNDHMYATGLFPLPNVWTHMAATRAPNGELTIYMNGNMIGHWDNTPAPTTECNQDLTIGGRWYNDQGEPYQMAYLWQGGIDEVRLYNRALSGDEIAGLANIPAPGAILLATIGCALLGYLRRRRTL